MIRAAWMYYHENMTHDQIAEKLHTSRVKITRMLQKARSTGLVEIRITSPLPVNFELGRQFEKQFGIKEAVIVPTSADFSETLEEIGRAVADYFMRILEPNCRIGFGWSSTLGRMVSYLTPLRKPMPGVICDLTGNMFGRAQPYSVSAKVAETLKWHFDPIPVPTVLRSKAARDAMVNEPAISSALAYARQSQVAFVGMGHTGDDSSMINTHYLTPQDMADLRARGAVGDVLMRYYDIEGRPVPNPLDERVIGLEWDDLRRIPHVVCVAAGDHKIQAILGILRSGLCHCLITDLRTAEAALQAAESPS